jgi:hypothetical protein
MSKNTNLSDRCAELAFENYYSDGKVSSIIRFTIASILLDRKNKSLRGLLSISLRSLINQRRPIEGNIVDRSVFNQGENFFDFFEPNYHINLGNFYTKRNEIIKAYSCYRTALTLTRMKNLNESDIEREVSQASKKITFPGSPTFSRFACQYDPFLRLRSLAGHVLDKSNNTYNILDIGGSVGFLSVLLPGMNYLLIDPDTNGISGISLPFESNSFDITICSHVIEHLPNNQRIKFLKEVIRLTKKEVLLLSPFMSEFGQKSTEEILLNITGAAWAKEHIEFGLPLQRELTEFMKSQNLNYEIIPQADQRVRFWQYLAMFFAKQAGETENFYEATDFFHNAFDYRNTNGFEPHDYLFKIYINNL